MYDPLGSLIVELREDAVVGGLVGSRVRGFEPAPGDAKPKGEYQRFIVLSRLGLLRPISGVPTQTVQVGIRCYGSTPQDAAVVMGAASVALHHVGPREGTSGGSIYATHVLAGGTTLLDPDTGQPYEAGTIEVICTT